MSEEDNTPNHHTYAIRVAEWSEWIPRVPDASSGGQHVPNGTTFLEALENEKLIEVQSSSTPAIIRRKVKFTGPTIMDMQVVEDEPSTTESGIELPNSANNGDSEDENVREVEFQFVMFKALLAQKVSGSAPNPIVIADPNEGINNHPDIVRASAETLANLPPRNRAERRAKKR